MNFGSFWEVISESIINLNTKKEPSIRKQLKTLPVETLSEYD